MRCRNKILTVATLAVGAVAQASSNESAIFPLSNDTEFVFMLEASLEFIFLVDRIHDKGEAINANRFPLLAREAYFRSATYYRAANNFLYKNISHLRIYSVWNYALRDFDKAISLLPVPAERVNISVVNFTITAIFYSATSSVNTPGSYNQIPFHVTKCPTVILGSEFDGSQEEFEHSVGRTILDRGWNPTTYEDPGQLTVQSVNPVVDNLTNRHGVDMNKVALIGVSFDRTLAPLAASLEHRLSAVVTVANGIHYPVLIGEGENDSSAPGQAQEMAQFPGKKATYNLFETDLGAGEYCQLGVETQVAQVAFNWLSDVREGISVPRGGVY
ncbi:Alpha/Beta hydrolase protein [Trichoderma austrokoningii]